VTESYEQLIEILKAQGYVAYLKTDHWRQLQQRTFAERGRQCERCDSVFRIVVHHKTYERIAREDLGDLEILCRNCHDRKHPRLAVLDHDPQWSEHGEPLTADEWWTTQTEEWKDNV
jgi:5-methylcytosine-specific restriction endonuclease McrA